MRFFAAGLIYIAVSTVAGLFLGMESGLDPARSFLALMAGSLAAIAAYYSTSPFDFAGKDRVVAGERGRFHSGWLWFLDFVFSIFALRCFLWLIYHDKGTLYLQSPNNLGDLGLHLTYIKNFAAGVKLWPDSPIYSFSKLRYPAGIDLFNGLLTCIGINLHHQLIATGLIASAATFYAFYRWGGSFAIAGFLFNGGLAGSQFLLTGVFRDYQNAPEIYWKNIALAMFVTQRGLLYAIPAGLLLLTHWRAKYGSLNSQRKGLAPTWVEYVLYATLPLFHLHAFMALSMVLTVLFVARPASRRQLLALVAAAAVPATFFVGLISDNFHASKILGWFTDWKDTSEFAAPFFKFVLWNFGILLPLVIILIAVVAWQEWHKAKGTPFQLSTDAVFLSAALLIFFFALLVKTAPWQWDNIKLFIWAYFIVLPILWRRLLAAWPLPAQVGLCFLLFYSGFVSLIGGLAAGRPGFEFASRAEVDYVAEAVRGLPVEARFASYPTYNHPLLLNGRKVVCGYTGHLWTQGIPWADVQAHEAKLRALMMGEGDWKRIATELRVRYVFWGPQEKQNYAGSSRPWEKSLPLVRQGSWGAIYEVTSD